MDDSEVLERMRSDWNQRADEDANYYVAFGRRNQDEEEFFATGEELAGGLALELKRFPGREAALEIGCGPGRLMRPMSRHFGEVHGVDVSDEMIRLARERLRKTPNAFAHHGSGWDLSRFADEKFDFVYSYAVFQHIPCREVVFGYLREAWRVLKPGGVLRCQMNGLPPHARQYDTWSGVRIAADEVRAFARESGFRLLALEQIRTQYMWVTCRKPGGAEAMGGGAEAMGGGAEARIRSVSNAQTGEAVAPESGVLAALSLWIEHLPEACDLNSLTVKADGRECRLTYIGPPAGDGVTQVNAALPGGLRTGLVPVEAEWAGRPLGASAWVRIMPAGPLVPRIMTVTDGINLLSGQRIVTGTVKVTMVEVADADGFGAAVDGVECREVDAFCADPMGQRWEFNFNLPRQVGQGTHQVEVRLGRRRFAPVEIEVA